MFTNQAQRHQSLAPSMAGTDVPPLLQSCVDLSRRGRLEPLDGLQGTAQGLGELDGATAATARAGDGGLWFGHLLHGTLLD